MESASELQKESIFSTHKSFFKQGLFSKPLNISITITSKHIYGQGFIIKQNNQQDSGPYYQDFAIIYKDIDSVIIKPTTNKYNALHIQSKILTGGIRQKIIIPNLKNPELALQDILKIKELIEQEEKVTEEKRKKQPEKINYNADADNLPLINHTTSAPADISIFDIMDSVDIINPAPEKNRK